MQKFFYKAVPILPVKNLEETIQYYKQQLGFKDEWYWGNPPTEAGCQRNSMSLLFKRNRVLAEKIQGFQISMFVDDIDGIYSEFSEKQLVKITSPIRDEPWGMREFTLEDINGYLLRISCSIERINRQKIKNHLSSNN